MDFEKQLIQVCQVDTVSPDPDVFLDRLRGKRVALQLRKQRLFMGTSMVVLLALIGTLTLSQLQNSMNTPPQEVYYTGLSLSAEKEQLLWEEMALYLLEHEGDLWSALEFFDEVNYEELTNLMEAN